MLKKALVVDADYFFVEFVGELLQKRGYAVTKAYDGKDGISKLNEHPHDVIFVDLVMPKVDGRRFIDFVRLKYGPNHFPIVALSGVMVEQLGSLKEIGADYYIAKGPIDKLTVQLNALMAEVETQPQFPSGEMKIMETGVFPRRDAVELLKALKFHQAVFESLAVGIVLVDVDARVVNVNPLAFEILGKSATEVLNSPVLDILPPAVKPKLGDALKQVAQLSDKAKISFRTNLNRRAVRISVTAILHSEAKAGWAIVLDDSN